MGRIDWKHALSGVLFWMVLAVCAKSEQPFKITVVEQTSGWPVPLVQLQTTHQLKWVTDNAGVVAIDAPELMRQPTWFSIESDGYEVPRDGFGNAGVKLTPEPGESVTIRVTRTSIARRLGRLTGAGLFGESQKLGEFSDWQEQGITGCDSVRLTPHRGKLHWVWGDTNLFHYPLGLFHTLGATTAPRPLKAFQPPIALKFQYVANRDGRPRNTAEITGVGPTWLDGVVSIKDRTGQSRLVACYAKIKKPMVTYQLGLCVWDESKANFVKYQETWNIKEPGDQPPTHPTGHVTKWTAQDGKTWLLFGDPFPTMKCPASFESWSDTRQWTSIEPVRELTSMAGNKINVHRGSIAWIKARKKWSCVFCQVDGDPSFLGEIWYTESPSPFGPWSPAIKVLSHRQYSFYNPRIQQELTPEDAGFLLFEGTYSRTFSRNQVPTPRYDYNQILYRVDFKELDQFLKR